MHFRQFYVGCLAHASYLVGDGGEAVVVDPSRDVEMYLEEAAAHGLTIQLGARDAPARRLRLGTSRPGGRHGRHHRRSAPRRARSSRTARCARAIRSRSATCVIRALGRRPHAREPHVPRVRAPRRRRALGGAHGRHAVRRRRGPRGHPVVAPAGAATWRGSCTTACTASCCGLPGCGPRVPRARRGVAVRARASRASAGAPSGASARTTPRCGP